MPAEDSCFFFFQAEDGIRDFHVTGVQTCALPIFASSQKDSPVNRVEAERCSPGSTCAPPFGISVFSIRSEAGTPKIHLAFSLRLKMPSRLEAAIVRCRSLRRSTRTVALARGSPAFPPTVAEPLLLGSGILRRPFLPFLHPSRNAVVATTVVVQTRLNRSCEWSFLR